MRQRRLYSWIVVAVAAVLILALFTDAIPWLRGPAPGTSVWYWPYDLRPFSRWWAAIAAGIAFLGVLGWWLSRRNEARWQTAVALTLLFASSVALQWGLLYADRAQPLAELVDRTLAVQTNGYFWTAANLGEIGPTLQNYPAAMSQFESDHARTHPPGLVLANWLTMQLLQKTPALAQRLTQIVYPQRCTDLWLLDQSAATAAGLGVWAVLPMLLGAAAVFPAYGLANNLSRSVSKAKTAVLVGTIPALLIFVPIPDQIFALLTLLIVWAYVLGWQRQNLGWLFASGMLLSLTTFFSVGNVALLAVLGSYTLFHLWQQPKPIGKIVRMIITFGLGLASIWLIYWLGWSVPPLALVQTGLNEHYALVTSQRSYGTWFFYNLLDLAIFVGLPMMLVFVLATIMAMRKLGQKSLSDGQILTVSTAVLVLLLDLSGSTRGEVGRIWLFLMPLLVICGGLWLAEWLPNWRSQWGWAALQVAWAIALGLSWRPMGATIVVAQQPPFPPMPNNSIVLNTSIGSQIILNRAALEQSANVLTLTLEWQASNPTLRPYTVFNHLIDAKGNLAAQADGLPANGHWPSTCWQAGKQVVDQYQITLSADLPAGTYTLRTGLYDPRDGTRLLTPDGADHVVIGQITLPAR